MNLADRLKTERKRLKYTQSSLASVLGISKQSIFNYENSPRSPDAAILVQLAGLGFDVHYILTSTPFPQTPSLTNEQSEILKLFSQATATGKEAAKAVLAATANPNL